ncbi:urease accessory protein UreE [Aminobacter sp. Y103A]|uniref:urease accessory protein UreE n=1 Tax=Aminobacter sp. Y103A TaxID=1870862 RepID=UPI0025745A19|nr:urease accessory protein UreE [Aminobacter sp. SS-2016]WMC97327.1 urease accessory protein UreE [Aminobacter aminovorans]BBD35491.1 urease accessory protein UreE [Aminobacter sp. SS-2016]
MLRATKIIRAEPTSGAQPFDVAVLAHDERHIRRRAIALSNGERVLVDLPDPVVLETGDLLLLEDGRTAGVVAAEEELYDIRARDAVQLTQLAWHIGNRHLAAAISADRILILRDHVIKTMLEGLGAEVIDIVAPFEPVRGAYSGHGNDHSHAHDHGHSHGHAHHHERSHNHGHDHPEHDHEHDHAHHHDHGGHHHHHHD